MKKKHNKLLLILPGSSFIMILLLIIISLTIVLYPINAAAEAIKIAKEDFQNDWNRFVNLLALRGWCTDTECFEKEEENYYIKIKEVNEKYKGKPYYVTLKIPLIQATIFYGADYEALFNPNAADFSEEDDEEGDSKAGTFDYRAAKNQLQDLINHLVFQDSKGKYYQDVSKYDDYLRDEYLEKHFPDFLETMSKQEIIDEIHAIAGYYDASTDLIPEVKDIITGSILDLVDPPYRGTECAITSPYTSSRGVKPHYAVDVVGLTDKKIYSSAAGTVVKVVQFTGNLYSKWNATKKICDCGGYSCPNGYGSYIVIEHTLNGEKYRTRYAHLSSILVREGESVAKGQQIGVEGNTGCSTGSHLHYEFYDSKGHKFDPTTIMYRCATQNATVNTCNLNNLKVRLTSCTDEAATPSSGVISELSFKDYVMGAMYAELYDNLNEPEFLKAMAVAIQTFTLNRGGYAENSGYIYLRGACGKDQDYKDINTAPAEVKAKIEKAINEVFGYVLLKDGKLMSGFYENNDNGNCGSQRNSICQSEGNTLAARDKFTMNQILANYFVLPQVVDYCTRLAAQSVSGIENTKANIACGAYTGDEIDEVNRKLESKVNNAGRGTRAGVVAAARYLTLDLEYKIPFFASETATKGRYYKMGLNTDPTTGWGCPVDKEGIPTTQQIPGGTYYNGLDASAFVSWALLNGGVGQGDLSSESLVNLGSASIPFGDERVTNGTVKIGDLYWDGGHIGIIIGIDDVNIYVAEEKGAESGLVVTKYDKTSTTVGNYYILMDSIYSKEGNIPKMW